jgi:hypothetical protein
MKYRLIIVAPLGDGALLVRCQEPATYCLEFSSPVLLCILISFIVNVNLVTLIRGLGPSLRASTIVKIHPHMIAKVKWYLQ